MSEQKKDDRLQRMRNFAELLKDATKHLENASIDIYHVDQELGVLDDGKNAQDIAQTRLSLDALRHDVEAARSRTALNYAFVQGSIARRAAPPEEKHEFALAVPGSEKKRAAKKR